MCYLKALFLNFLTVFFANHILPGIDVVNQTKLPHLGGDLPFALGLGFLNSLIYPVLKLFDKEVSAMKIALGALVINFASYAVLKLLPIGINITTLEGYLLVAIVVSLGSFLTNFFELKRCRNHHKMEPPTTRPPEFPS